MPRVEILFTYGDTFEGGYTYPFTIERWLDDPIAGIGGDDPPVLMVPPFGPGGKEDAWGLGMSTSPQRAVLELEATGVDLDQVPPFDPAPGRGLGSFMPPGVLTAEGLFHKMTRIEVKPSS